MDSEALFATIQGLGAICALCFFALFYMAIFHISRHDAFVDLATRNQRKPPFDDFPPPFYHPRRLWRMAFLIMAWIGGGYVVFAVASALVAWMPEDWRIWGGDWDGAHIPTVIALFVAGFSMFILPVVWDKVTASSRQRRRREDEAYCLARIEDLIERILTRPADHDGFSAAFAERLLRTYVACGMLAPDRADKLMVMVKTIEVRVRETRPDFDFQRWYETNIAFEVGTLTQQRAPPDRPRGCRRHFIRR